MRKSGVQIEALIEYVALFRQGDSTAEARKNLLIEQRSQLMERMEDMRATLERLNSKIEHYEESCFVAEQALQQLHKQNRQ